MDLKELLGEELYNQVTAKAGEHKIAVVSDGNWFPKEKFDEVNSQVKEYKKQLADRDKQLEDLKAKAAGNEELQKQIQQLQDQNNQIKDQYEKQLQEQQFNFALKEALTSAKARNPKAVEALLNKEAIKLDGDKLLGLDEQLKSLKESDPYLFDIENDGGQQQKPTFTTGQHQSSGNGDAFVAALLGKQE